MNRHAVYVWDPRGRALPVTIEGALEQARDLSERPEEPSEHLLGFAGDMELYANKDECIDDQDVYAAIGNLRELLGGAAIEIDLSMVNSDQVLVELVDCGSRHGLVLVDDLIRMAFLPKGKILPKSSAISWGVYNNRVRSQETDAKVGNADDYPKTLKSFIKWAEPIYSLGFLLSGFNEIGFSNENPPIRVFTRRTEYGAQHITVDYCGSYPYFGANFGFIIICDPVNEILSNFNFKSTADKDTISMSISRLTDYKMQHKQKPVCNGSIQDDIVLVRHYIIGLLDASRDLRGLDNLVNGGVLGKSAQEILKCMCPQRLILAKLADNKNFESIYIQCIGYDYWGMNEVPRRNGEADRLMHYLRSEVNPLTD